jgi:hypothetical protein
MFRFSCLHCESTRVAIDTDCAAPTQGRDRHFLVCQACAWVLYGDAAIENAVKIQRAAYGERETVAGILADLSRDYANFPAMDRCAWRDCEAARRPSSIYCSRKCCVKNAHYRDRMRKKGMPAQRRAA